MSNEKIIKNKMEIFHFELELFSNFRTSKLRTKNIYSFDAARQAENLSSKNKIKTQTLSACNIEEHSLKKT